jgi:hypothetical protein
MGLSEAAAATGLNRSTIYRAWKSGKLTANRTDSGQIEVDPAELFRVFPPVATQEAEHSAAHYGAQPRAMDDNALRVSALEVEVKLLREMLEATRNDRAAWRDQAARVMAALPPPAPIPSPVPHAAPAPDQRRSWWRRLAG